MISKQIQELLLICENNSIKHLFTDFLINWDEVSNLLDTAENLDDQATCLKLKKLTDPMINACNESLFSHPNEYLAVLDHYAQWTYSVKDLKFILEKFLKEPQKYALAGFLQLASIIEFALGNVYQTFFSKQSPHLLKDLLMELRNCELFEAHQIFILQILLGTSKGVNLRNLAWHGFLQSIDPRYLSFLFVVVVMSYGKQLENVIIGSKLRKPVKLTINIKHENFNNILSFSIIQNCNFEAWKLLIEFYKESNFKIGIYLLLSQIENLLRKIYGLINEIDVTAELNKYYVIMDSIFYGYVLGSDITPLVIGKITKVQECEIRKNHARNRLLDYFPRSIFYLHYDLFYATDGPRLRDKISHGEVAIDNDEKIFLILLRFASLIAEYYENKKIYFEYESIYHSSVIFYRKITNMNEILEHFFMSLEIPAALKTDKIIKFEKVVVDLNIENLEIHFRPLIEAQIVRLMLNILDTLEASITNFQQSSNELFQLFNERKLSSSRRKVLVNLIDFLPNFSRGFHAVLDLVLKIFSTVQKLDDSFEDDNWSMKIIKILKQTLQLTQVYQKHLSVDDRNYFIANTRTCEFLSQTIDNNRHMF